jgi:hypothetical protein
MNNIHKHIEFKLTAEENGNISYLDISIHRDNSHLQMGIYRKPMQTDTTIHFMSNHPLEHKLAVYNFSHEQNAIYTNHRTSKTTRMGHYLHLS